MLPSWTVMWGQISLFTIQKSARKFFCPKSVEIFISVSHFGGGGNFFFSSTSACRFSRGLFALCHRFEGCADLEDGPISVALHLRALLEGHLRLCKLSVGSHQRCPFDFTRSLMGGNHPLIATCGRCLRFLVFLSTQSAIFCLCSVYFC